ncbi:oligoendopeptidase F [Lacticaseibacillus jixianensis]|uniref:Oligopeptidase F n=1 Tax=Lacticaseibacillus jixianensis TaxID=2486012 RepID=A0ABW4B976_9LACO|nr:oligoendopeptidase F [Lacticaseibacillus jixianensis]
MTQAQPARREVAQETTWDLTPLFKNETAFNEALRRLQELTADFTKMYRGQLTAVPVILDALGDYTTLQELADRIMHYGFLPQAADTGDPQANARNRKVQALLASTDAKLQFFQTELQAQPLAVLDGVAATSEDNAAFIRHVKLAKKQALPLPAEEVLAALAPALDAPSQMRSQAIFADMDFGSFTVAGKTYPLSFVRYEEEYQKHPNTAVRRAAYHQFCNVLAKYQNTIAAGYYNQVAKEKTIATMRGYDSVVDYLLADQEVSRDMFDRQIDGLMAGLAPVMRRYVTHIKQLWGLDHIGYTDLQVDLDPSYAPQVTLAQAPQAIKDAVAPLGKDYQGLIMRAFFARWVDFPANRGKESGAFASGAYGVHPYILMSWSNTLPALYTLVHELGHAGHFSLAEQHHSILAVFPSTYIVEAPSTFHELLLTHSLINKAAGDLRLQRFALSRLLSDTYFHNCVTHLLEAAFQREVYTLIDRGETFDAATLNQLKKGLLKQFWGDAVDLDDGMPELTWMRQSHYYMGLYSYTYSASMVVSTAAYLKVRAEGQPAIAHWLQFLALGDTKPPLEAAKVAGVDISTDQPLKAMIAFLDDTEKQIEQLSANL